MMDDTLDHDMCEPIMEAIMYQYYKIDFVMDGVCAGPGCRVREAHNCLGTLEKVLDLLEWEEEMGLDLVEYVST